MTGALTGWRAPMPEYKHTSFVAPIQARPAPQLPTLIESEPLHIEAALQAHTGAEERTSATDRAIGLAIRIAPFSLVWAALAIGGVWAIGAAWWAGFMFFAALTFVSYAWLDGQDWRHSRAGVERFKVDRAYRLKRIEMESQAEARRLAIGAYIRMLEKHDD